MRDPRNKNLELNIRDIRDTLRTDARIRIISWKQYSAALQELNRLAREAGLDYMVW